MSFLRAHLQELRVVSKNCDRFAEFLETREFMRGRDAVGSNKCRSWMDSVMTLLQIDAICEREM